MKQGLSRFQPPMKIILPYQFERNFIFLSRCSCMVSAPRGAFLPPMAWRQAGQQLSTPLRCRGAGGSHGWLNGGRGPWQGLRWLGTSSRPNSDVSRAIPQYPRRSGKLTSATREGPQVERGQEEDFTPLPGLGGRADVFLEIQQHCLRKDGGLICQVPVGTGIN